MIIKVLIVLWTEKVHLKWLNIIILDKVFFTFLRSSFQTPLSCLWNPNNSECQKLWELLLICFHCETVNLTGTTFGLDLFYFLRILLCSMTGNINVFHTKDSLKSSWVHHITLLKSEIFYIQKTPYTIVFS